MENAYISRMYISFEGFSIRLVGTLIYNLDTRMPEPLIQIKIVPLVLAWGSAELVCVLVA